MLQTDRQTDGRMDGHVLNVRRFYFLINSKNAFKKSLNLLFTTFFMLWVCSWSQWRYPPTLKILDVICIEQIKNVLFLLPFLTTCSPLLIIQL